MFMESRRQLEYSSADYIAESMACDAALGYYSIMRALADRLLALVARLSEQRLRSGMVTRPPGTW